MKTKKVYVGGALFSESEIAQRKIEGAALRQNPKLQVFNPIEAPINDKAKLPSALDIFGGDTTEVLESDYILAEINNKIDEGLVAELAICWTWNWVYDNLQEMIATNSKDSLYQAIETMLEQLPKKQVVAYASDIRMATASQYSGITIPVGFNQYVVGMLQDMQTMLYNSSKEATDYITREVEHGQAEKNQ